MASLQVKYFYFVELAWYLMLAICQAQQLGNSGNTRSPMTEDRFEGISYFYQRPEFPKDCQEIYHQCSSLQNASGVYAIKPDGYSEPFEVFCDNSVDSGGWTTIFRRTDGSLDFSRNWTEYETGFGFVGTEFWLGNERLSFMVNQRKYKLRIDITNNEGTSCYLTYDNFRISDGWGNFALAFLGRYSRTAEQCVNSCPTNMEFGNCTCQPTCEDPRSEDGCNNAICIGEETCVCPDGFLMKDGDCILEEDCGCYLEGEGVIKEGKTFVNSDCSRRFTCNDNHLTLENLLCSVDATCRETEGSYQCQCNPGFVGDGQTCSVIAIDCLDLYNNGVTTDGVYTIYPTGWSGSGFEVFCEMESNGGGWTLFQRRLDGALNFYRDWASYKQGFGTLSHEFWLGNDKIHTLTRQRNYQLRIDTLSPNATPVYSLYSSFNISDESDKYRLNVGTESGDTVGNPLNHNNGEPFSTYDQDNDDSMVYNCAEKHRGWWYSHLSHYYYKCYHLCFKWRISGFAHFCSDSNLNGDYQETGVRSVFFWYSDCYSTQPECGMTRTEMKIRSL